MTMRTTFIGCLAALLVLGAGLPAQKKPEVSDTIIRTTGARLRNCEVVTDSLEKLVYKQGGVEKSIPGSQVESILWSGAPEAFARAEHAEANKEYMNAANLFAEAASTATRAPIKAEAAFRAAQCQVLAAAGSPEKAAGAAEAMKAFLAANPESRFLPQASLARALALRHAGRTEDAVAVLKEVEDASLTKGWGPIWDARAKYDRARTLVAGGRLDEAGFAFQAAAAALRAVVEAGGKISPEVQELAIAAEVGPGETRIAARKFDEASTYFGELASRAGANTSLLTAAWSGQAEALYFQGLEKKDGKLLRQAQELCARAVVRDLFDGETTAKALYYTGRIYQALEKDRDADDLQKKAADYFQRVVRYYGTTAWADKARSELAR